MSSLFDRSSAEERDLLERSEQPEWVTPTLVAEIGFTEFTASGKLRRPRFLGLRRDKAAKDVVREKAEA